MWRKLTNPLWWIAPVLIGISGLIASHWFGGEVIIPMVIAFAIGYYDPWRDREQ